MKLHKKFLRQAGLSLMEVILSVTITAASLVGVNALVSNYTTENKNTLVADQMRRAADAYTAYIKDNYSAILAIATEVVPYQISINDLVTKGYLPTESAATNAYGQNLCALVRNVGGSLQGLVITESGEEIKKADLGSIASQVGSRAGALLDTDENGQVSNVITGVKKSWSLPISAFHNLSNNSPSHANASVRCDGSPGKVQLTPGHLAVVLWFENTFTQASTIYRDAVPGAPQLNRMNTPLVMNSPQTVGAACTASGAIANDGTGTVVYCTGGTWRRPANSMWWGDPVPSRSNLPTCTFSLNGNVRVIWGAAPPATHPSVYTCNGRSWAAVGIDDEGNLNVPGSIGTGTLQLGTTVTENTECTGSQLATLSRNANGEVLVCRMGELGPSWTKTNSSTQCQKLPQGFDFNRIWSPEEFRCAEVNTKLNAPTQTVSGYWLVTSHATRASTGNFIHQTAKDVFLEKVWKRTFNGSTWSAWNSDAMNGKIVQKSCGPATPQEYLAYKDTFFSDTGYAQILHQFCNIELKVPGQWQVSAMATRMTEAYVPTALWINYQMIDHGGNFGDLEGAAQEILHGTTTVTVGQDAASQSVQVQAAWGRVVFGGKIKYGTPKMTVTASYIGP